MDLQKLLPQVLSVSEEGAAFLRQARDNFKWDDLEYKGTNDLVSYVDKETEKLLVQKLRTLLPAAGFITEEGTVSASDNPLQWVIDPLDGTTNFVHGIPMYAISIGLLSEGVPVLGVVHEVTRDERFYACQGGKAYCNGKVISVSPQQYLRDSVLATGYPQVKFDRLDDYLNVLRSLMRKTHGIRRMGSAATDLAYVACGRVSGFFENNLNSYDVAAGICIVLQAGGTITDFKGGNDYVFGREIIAANAVHGELLEVIRTHWDR